MLASYSDTITRQRSLLRTAARSLTPYLDDDAVNEIMLNPDGRLWIDVARRGMLDTGAKLSADDATRILQLVATEMGTELSRENPSIAGKLPIWGLRVQGTIPPVVDAPSFALRKPARFVYTLDEYVKQDILTASQAATLKRAVRDRVSILVGGSPGSGKTTLINALLAELARLNERVYIVEDNLELQCAAQNKVQVLVQPPVYTWQRAMVDARRYNPERVIVGEVRDGAALEMIKIFNSGQPGMGTIHANDTASMLDQVVQYCQEVVMVPPRPLIADVVRCCVHITRDRDHPGGRRITGIDRVVGVSTDGRWSLEPML